MRRRWRKYGLGTESESYIFRLIRPYNPARAGRAKQKQKSIRFLSLKTTTDRPISLHSFVVVLFFPITILNFISQTRDHLF